MIQPGPLRAVHPTHFYPKENKNGYAGTMDKFGSLGVGFRSLDAISRVHTTTSVRITLIRNTDNLINLISAYSLPVVRSIGQKGIIIIEFPLGIEWPRYHHSVSTT